MNEPSIVQDRKRGVNYGIGIVVPASKIIETVNSPELLKLRKTQEEEILQRSVPGTDSAKPKERESPFTKTDFEAALKKVSRKIEPKKT